MLLVVDAGNAHIAFAVHDGSVMDIPSEMGVDRLVMTDFVTATTSDVIDADGGHCSSGALAPGISLSVEASHTAVARTPPIGPGRPRAVARHEFSASMKVVATGGLAPLFSEGAGIIERIASELTRGWRLLAARNPTSSLLPT